MRFNFLLASALTLSLVGSACGNGVRPETRDTVRFSALETDKIETQIIDDPGPTANAKQRSTYEPIVQGVRDNRAELFSRADVSGQLERIEGVFIATGEYLELVGYYQEHVEASGPNDEIGRRLVWALIRLGQMKQSRDLIDSLLESSPRDPVAHFLDGSYYLQTERESVEDRKKAIAGWERAVELAPNFRGYEGITAAMMTNQIQQMRASLPEEDEDAQESESPEALAVAAAQAVAESANGPVGEQPSTALAEAGEGSEEAAESTEAAEVPPAEAASTGATAEGAETAEAAPKDSAREYRLLVARGEIALSQNKFEEAENYFLDAKKIQPEGFDAELGQLRAGWGVEAARNVIAGRVRKLAERELSGDEAFRLGRFVWTKMQDRPLARELLEDAKAKDPGRARAADALLDAM